MNRLAKAGVNEVVWLQTGLLLAYFILRSFLAEKPWPLAAAEFVLPWLFIPLLALFPLALWLRSRAALVGVAISSVLFLLTYGAFFLPALPGQATGTTFTVMTYNVFLKNEQADSVLTEVAANNPDIVGLQELYPPNEALITRRLKASYPYWNVEPGVGLFSRYPIHGCESVRTASGISGLIQRCQITLDDHSIAVYNVHIRPARLLKGQVSGLSMVTGLEPEQHNEDLRLLLSILEGEAEPVIIMGDFNMIDQEPHYIRLRHALKDAYRERGWGFGFTYSRFPETGIPIWRIDYIFHSPMIRPLDSWVGNLGGSDHRPVIARLGF